MTPDNYERQQLLDLECEMWAQVAEMKGMEAENKQREIQAKSMTFIEKDFIKIRDELMRLSYNIQNVSRL